MQALSISRKSHDSSFRNEKQLCLTSLGEGLTSWPGEGTSAAVWDTAGHMGLSVQHFAESDKPAWCQVGQGEHRAAARHMGAAFPPPRHCLWLRSWNSALSFLASAVAIRENAQDWMGLAQFCHSYSRWNSECRRNPTFPCNHWDESTATLTTVPRGLHLYSSALSPGPILLNQEGSSCQLSFPTVVLGFLLSHTALTWKQSVSLNSALWILVN